MKPANRECRRLSEIQAKVFEKSVSSLDMSSKMFVKRFMNSDVAKEFDSGAFLDGTKTIDDVFASIEEQYGKSSFGSVKYHREVMFWSGYLYRHFCYCYEISSKQAYKMLPFDYVARTYEPYHTLDILQAIERLLEAKNISFDEEEINKKGLTILRRIRLG